MVTELALRFFFYGTLIGGTTAGEPVRAALGKLRDLGPAQVPGTLHAIPDPQGWYPALAEGPDVVAGRAYAATALFGAADLAALDAYEDCDLGDPAGSLYLRKRLRSGEQAYLFNQLLPAASRVIPGGDFAAWLVAEGLPVFRS